MTNRLKDLFEVYRPKTKDEADFVDKHVTIKHKDRNGNGDDVFQAKNIKKSERKKERHGYEPGEDEKVYEDLTGKQHKIDANKNGKVDAHDFKLLRGKKKVAEEVEELDEISKKTLGSYINKASGAERPKNPMNPKSVPITTIAAYQGDSETGHFGKRFNQATYDKAERLRKNRETGIKTAVNKLTKEAVEADDDTVEKNEMAQNQLHFLIYAAKEINDFIEMGGEVEEWYQNKLSKAHSDMEGLHSYIEGEKRRTGMVKESVTQLSEGMMKLSKVHIVHHHDHPAAKEFAKNYTAGKKGDHRDGGPTPADDKAAVEFDKRYTAIQTRSGFAGSGTHVYTDHKTGAMWKVDRHPNGKTFYGTDHIISHVT